MPLRSRRRLLDELSVQRSVPVGMFQTALARGGRIAIGGFYHGAAMEGPEGLAVSERRCSLDAEELQFGFEGIKARQICLWRRRGCRSCRHLCKCCWLSCLIRGVGLVPGTSLCSGSFKA